MTPSSLVDSLDRLASALVRMDHATVESCGSRLEEIANQIRYSKPPPAAGQRPSVAELEELRTKVRFCLALSQNAAHFHAGWGRLASLQGAAYTPSGNEPMVLGSNSMVVNG